MKSTHKIHRLFYQNYRQFIEYINDLKLPTSLYLILIYMPSLFILSDLFLHVDSTHFLHNLSQLTASNLLFNLTVFSQNLLEIIKAVLFFLLLFPFLILIIMLYRLILVKQEDLETGYFYNYYANSSLCGIIRLYMSIYQHVIYPFILSYSIKLLLPQQGLYQPIFGIVFLSLAVLNSLIFHYYSLQIPSPRNYQNQYRQINFPNVIVQSILLMLTFILINLTKGMAPYICCVSLYILRFMTNRFLKFETGKFYNQSQFSIICGMSISLAVLIGHFSHSFSAMSVSGCIVLAILLINKKTGEEYEQNTVQWEQLKVEQTTIDDVKYLVSIQRMSKAFRQAVILSRKKNSHRDQLTIDILKNKCYCLQRQSRGSIKTANSKLLLQYEQKIMQIMRLIAQVQQKSIEILTLMKNKQPKQQSLIKSVIELINLIDQNKAKFVSCMKINILATQLAILMHLFFKQLYNDNNFIRETYNKFRSVKNQTNSKIIQKQLFNKETVLIVINALDQVGKIVNVSNSLPNVLGYNSINMIGLSINQIIPLTIRNVHDSILTKFINKFTSQVARNRPFVQSYAYTKQFHLQRIQMRYNFFFHLFQNFHFTGIVRKLQTEEYLIITDEIGNIQGWTQQIGQIFNFDQISGLDCNSYNIFPLLPTFIKYNYSESYSFRTIFFRLSKMKNPKLMLFDSKSKLSIEQIKNQQMQTFLHFLQSGDFIQGFLVNLSIQIVTLQTHNKSFRLIKFQDIKRLENFEKLQSAILGQNVENKDNPSQYGQQFDFSPNLLPDKSIDQSQDAQYSILKTAQKSYVMADLNFSLQLNKPDVININCLKFNKDLQKFQNMYSSRSLLKIDVQQQNNQNTLASQNLSIQSTFNPKIQRKNNYVSLIIFVTIAVLSILIQGQVSLTKAIQKLESNRTQLAKANRAQMIFCKSVFNPNQTYISEFDAGNLMVKSQWLLNEHALYTTSDNITIQQNWFYMLNVQIPSILDQVSPLNQPQNKYRIQMSRNFKSIINLYDQIFLNYRKFWQKYIDEVKMQNIYKLIALGFGSVIYLVFLFFINRRYQNQRKMTEAFFKFQRSDLDQKISNIKSITSVLRKRCQEWFVDQQIVQPKKINQSHKNTFYNFSRKQATYNNSLQNSNSKKKIINANATNSQQISQRRFQDDESDVLQIQLSKKRFYLIIGLVVIILLSQGLFLILHGILTNNLLNQFTTIMQRFDQANKLAVYPNLKIANLVFEAPSQIMNSYEQSLKKTLEQPAQQMSDLFNLLSQSPCQNCTFMPEILSTNYRSFYSHFIEVIKGYNINNPDLKELYYAVDVVVQNVTKSLTIKSISDPSLISLLYIFSLIVFFTTVIVITRDLEEECLKLECFLKFFDFQTLVKNKHLTTIMAKNT